MSTAMAVAVAGTEPGPCSRGTHDRPWPIGLHRRSPRESGRPCEMARERAATVGIGSNPRASQTAFT